MNWFKRWQIYRILTKHAIPDRLWFDTTGQMPLINSLNTLEKKRLRVLSTLFIHEKAFSGAGGLQFTRQMKVLIAVQACLLILNLELESYAGWHEIILYPNAFMVNRETQDEAGLITLKNNVLSGEAWDRGPVILSWEDVERDSFHSRPGSNVVIHEFAHKLDMLNGHANGMPPLPRDMEIEAWTESLSEAFQHLNDENNPCHDAINSYATTSPAEFFAVICEYFFSAPEILLQIYPEVYFQLRLYFRQDPLQRMDRN